MKVSCSACADWPRALQKHNQRANNNYPTQVTPSHDAERQLTRENFLHIHSACLSTAARAYSSEKHAPLQSAKRKQSTSGLIFFGENWVLFEGALVASVTRWPLRGREKKGGKANLIGRGTAGFSSKRELRLRAPPWGGRESVRLEVNCFLSAPCKGACFSER